MSYAPLLAIIDEQQCIGCTICIKACPFDAIIGASQQNHAVLSQLCTGCKLCVEPCPVDCIRMQENSELRSHTPIAPVYSQHQACVNCDQCAPVCPSSLQPDKLYRAIKTKKFHHATTINQCTQCGECDKVCPSQIPLSNTFAYGKDHIELRQQQKIFLQAGKARAQKRQARLASKDKLKETLHLRNKQSIEEKLRALKNSQNS